MPLAAFFFMILTDSNVITSVKSFITLATVPNIINFFTAVITPPVAYFFMILTDSDMITAVKSFITLATVPNIINFLRP
jgi:hypothetical protein